MTREEAKEFLINISYDLGTLGIEDYTLKYGKKMRDAIKTLKKEPCEDCISRQTVIDEMEKRHAEGDCITKGFIKNLPSVTPIRPKGYWIDRWDKVLLCEDKNCSVCGYLAQTKYNYCPNCGADMRGVEE